MFNYKQTTYLSHGVTNWNYNYIIYKLLPENHICSLDNSKIGNVCKIIYMSKNALDLGNSSSFKPQVLFQALLHITALKSVTF